MSDPPEGATGHWPSTSDAHPAWVLVCSLSAVVVLLNASGPLLDVDRYWHVSVGREILEQRTLTLTEPWSFVQRPPWTSSAWLSEVMFAGLHAWFGDLGFRLLKLTIAVGTLILLCRLIFRRGVHPGNVVVFSIVALSLAPYVTERPQLFSLPLLVWLSWSCQRLLVEQRPPSWWHAGLVAFGWANLHGLWVLVPIAFGTALLAVAWQAGTPRPSSLRPCLAVIAASLIAGSLTPAGPLLALAAFRMHSAASGVVEWQPLVLASAPGLGLIVLLTASALAWARSEVSIPKSELLWTLSWFGFATLAVRNVGPAILLLAPVVANRLVQAWPSPVLRVPWVGLIAILAAGVAGSGSLLATQSHLAEGTPIALVEQLHEAPAPVRVLNDQAVGGLLIAYGGEHVKIAVDGRADRYGHAFLERYRRMLQLRPGWAEMLDDLRPSHALLPAEVPLAGRLLEDGWRQVAQQGDYLLLARR